MRRYVWILLLCCICGNFWALSKSEPNHRDAPIENLSALETPEEPQDTDEGTTILMLFTGIITNFANILTNPKNPTVVGPNLAHILAGIINIAMTATKRGDLSLDASPEEIIEYFKLDHVEKRVRTYALRKARQVRTNLYRTQEE